MSQIYTEHFALLADHLNKPVKAYAVLEHARGRAGRRSEAWRSLRPAEEDERVSAKARLPFAAGRKIGSRSRTTFSIHPATLYRMTQPAE